MRRQLFFAAFFLSTGVMASVTECEIAAIKGLETQYVRGLYDAADVVIELGPEVEKIDEDLAKFRVAGTWKGEIGEYVYLAQGQAAPVFFGQRTEGNVLKAIVGHRQFRRCPYIRDVMIAAAGASQQPSASYFYRNHASALLVWAALFALLAVTGFNVVLYRWLNGSK